MMRGSIPAAWACSVALASPLAYAELAAPARGSGETPVVEVRAEPEPSETVPSGDDALPAAAESPAGDAIDPAHPNPPEPEPEPPRSVFAPTDPPKPGDGVPEAPLGPGIPGGYWDAERARPPEPKDGEEEVLVGSIILPIGIISAASSAAMVWLSTPGHCQQRWATIDAHPDASACKGVYAFGWVRITYGSLMVITGAALLGVGLHRRHQHQAWDRRYALRPRVGVGFASTGATVSLSLRVGLRPRRDRRR
jgi:hypothetical protein